MANEEEKLSLTSDLSRVTKGDGKYSSHLYEKQHGKDEPFALHGVSKRPRAPGSVATSSSSESDSGSSSSLENTAGSSGRSQRKRRQSPSKAHDQEEHRRKRHKQDKEKKKSSKHKRKRDDQAKKKKKKKKDKKLKKSSSDPVKGAAEHFRLGAVDQNEYGKYGIIRQSDFHRVSQSFEAWLREIKKEGGSKHEVMELFKEYMEDFNTATMPHPKYYDIEKWEMAEYQRQASLREASSRARRDEDLILLARQKAKEEKEKSDFRQVLASMDKDKIEAMRRQEHLRGQMQLLYKAGKVSEARRIEALLATDDK